VKKILIISTSAAYGGGPFHISQLLNSLKDRFEFYICCPDEFPYMEIFGKIVGKEHIFIIPKNTFSINSLIGINSFCIKKGISILHSHGKGAGIYARFLGLSGKYKVIHTFHGLHFREYSILKKNFYLKLESLLSNFTDKFISVGESEKKDAINFFNIKEDKIEVIHNGIEASTVKVFPRDNNKRFKVLWINRFDSAKNPELALNIAEYLKDEDIDFLMAGDGGLLKKIKRSCLKRGLKIDFPGYIEQPEILMKHAHVLLSTSKWEGLPYSILTAQSMGLPCVATDVTGNRDIIENGKNGILYTESSPEKAAEAIMFLKDNKDKWSQMSENSIIISTTRFSLKKMIEHTAKVYLNI